MNDFQLVSLAITLLAIFAGILFNNVRISDLNTQLAGRFGDISKRIDDVRDLIRAEIKAATAEMKAEIGGLRSEMKAETAEMRAEIADLRTGFGSLRTEVGSLRTLVERNHETTQASLADIDARVSGLEQRAA